MIDHLDDAAITTFRLLWCLRARLLGVIYDTAELGQQLAAEPPPLTTSWSHT